MIAILSPMEAEIKKTAEYFTSFKRSDENFRAVSSLGFGEIERGGGERESVFLGVTGVGKVLTASAVQEVITRLSPRYILFGGIAGGIAEDLQTGALVIAEDAVQWDMDVSDGKIKKGRVPFLGPGGGIQKNGFVNLDSGLQAAAVSAAEDVFEGRRISTAATVSGAEHSVQLRRGRVATGDTFLGGNAVHTKEKIRREFKADIVDMEGWSAAGVCALNRTPLLLLRIVSDTIRGDRPKNMRKFIDYSSVILAELFLEIAKSEED
ncbi:MAG: 5'-methylthioadenosine/S-adenosylhomocysteine nucleosidase [Spirochaetaceae bacterium]